MSFKLSNPYGAPAHQADAVLSQDDPVADTWYTVLDTTTNVRIIDATIYIVWTVQPNPLDMRITIDGNVIVHTVANPISATFYSITTSIGDSLLAQSLSSGAGLSYAIKNAFMYEGRSVKVEMRTGHTTAGTVSNLTGRVQYAKW